MNTAQNTLVCLVMVAGGLSAQSTPLTLVVPNANATSPGNTSSSVSGASGSFEIQELLGAGQFPGVPILITGIALRAAPGTGPINEGVVGLNVYLSTSPNAPNTSGSGKTLMSSTFANNVGPDKTLVFSGSNPAFSDSGCSSGNGPCPFDINIVFATPFNYNSTGGPLLIDLFETNINGKSGAIDAESFTAPGGSVAQVVGTMGSATGTFSYGGFIVQVTYTTQYPVFTGAVNGGSGIPPGLPNSGIAQGSLFVAYGANLGAVPAAGTFFTAASLPLPNTLAGTSATVTVNGTTVNAPMLFTLQSQIGAVMPSNTPVGSGTLTLTYNGKSGSTPVTVVQSTFGMSNIATPNGNNNLGVLNTGAVTFGTNPAQPVLTTNTASPGDILIAWGTGLGPTTVAGDSAGAPFGNIGSTPLVFVGGVQSPSVAYWGRSPGSAALDQIVFTVPQNAPLGCNVSVVVQTSNGGTPAVSNGPTIALAATDGATCSDPSQYIPSSYLGKSSVKVISVALQQQAFGCPPGEMCGPNNTNAKVEFLEFTQAQLAATAPLVNVAPSFGSCYTGFAANGNMNGGGGPASTLLNAGASVTMTPPSGSPINLSGQPPGFYKSDSSSSLLPSGNWKLSNGAGGPDVGPLNLSFSVPQQVTWSNQSAVYSAPIDRTTPLMITWTGGDSNGYVDITGTAQNTSGTYLVGFECTAPATAGQFIVPPSILQAMPPGANMFGSLSVTTISLPFTLGNVTGFDAALDTSGFETTVPVSFK